MISFLGVYKYYDSTPIIQNLSFEIKKGELVFITGPSGAGKTTLLKMIFGSERPDEGEIRVGDFELSVSDSLKFHSFEGWSPLFFRILSSGKTLQSMKMSFYLF